MAKELRRIELITKPNGYTLDIDGNSYMYFSENELLEGFLVHVGLDHKEYVGKDEIKTLIDASVAWKDRTDVMEEIVRLSERVKSLQSSNQNLRKRLKNKKDSDDYGGQD